MVLVDVAGCSENIGLLCFASTGACSLLGRKFLTKSNWYTGEHETDWGSVNFIKLLTAGILFDVKVAFEALKSGSFIGSFWGVATGVDGGDIDFEIAWFAALVCFMIGLGVFSEDSTTDVDAEEMAFCVAVRHWISDVTDNEVG